ncbi:MAG: DEAD/DEAH box helicase [Moraxellaceae bacterium]|nr:DEAD/DEAH box helicase [Moraxellaceae bacterium]
MSFSSLNLHEDVQRALAAAGYTEPTPVQAQAIPPAMEGKDLIVSAQTGTGKTAAFMLPALSKIADNPRKVGRGPRVLVLTPTRELAQQVTAAAQKYGSEQKDMRTVSVLGGMPFPAQNRLLSRPYDIMVATPGRLLDHMSRGRIVFDRLELLILDEADRMLDMGFIDDVEQIASACPADRQTLLFSATFEDRLAKLAGNLLKDPIRIDIAGHTTKNEQILQRAYYADDLSHKKQLLLSLLNMPDVNQAIVFAGTRIDSDALAEELAEFGIAVDALHGDMKQAARNRTLNGLRTGRTKVLVATDVAARGIDVPGISHVINYDLPKNAEDYVHRIGRTGRAGRTGIACSLVGPRDRGVLRRIEQFVNQTLPVEVIEGLEPKRRSEDRPRRAFAEKPRWDHKDRTERDDRRPSFRDRNTTEQRAPRAAHAGSDQGDRRPRPEGGTGERRSFGDRPPRDAAFADRPKREDRGSINYDERQPVDNSNRSALEGFNQYPRREFNKPRTEGGFAGGGERRPYAGAGTGERKPYAGAGTGERRPYAGAGTGERKPYAGAGTGERRPYAGAGTGERRPYAGASTGTGERKPYAGAGTGERKPYAGASDRPKREGFGDRPPRRDFGDRKPRPEGGTGERRSFGDRPQREGGFASGTRQPSPAGDRPREDGFGNR